MRTPFVVSLLALAACDAEPECFRKEKDYTVALQWQGGTRIVVRAEHFGQGEGRKTGAWILENEREWKAFWAERRASETPPAPDFRDMFAVAYVRTLSESDRFERVQAYSSSEALHVVMTAVHEPDAVAGVRRDHAVAVVPRTNQPVRLHFGHRSWHSWAVGYEAPRSVWSW